MFLHDFLDHGEAEAGAAVFPVSGKRLEDLGAYLRRDAGPVISDADFQALRRLPAPHFDSPGLRRHSLASVE